MDDTVTQPEGTLPGTDLRLPFGFRVYHLPQPFIQCVHAGIPLLPVGGQHLHLVLAKRVHAGAVQLLCLFCGLCRAPGRDEGKSRAIIQGGIILLHPLRIGGDPAVLCLAENHVKHCHRYHAALYQLPEHVSGAYAGELVHIPHQHQACPRPDMVKKDIGQPHVGHGELVRYDEACLQHALHFLIVLIAGKPKGAVHGHGVLPSCAFRHPAACPSRGRCQQHAAPAQLFIDIQEHLLHRGLPCPGASRDNADQMAESLPHALLLFRGKADAQLPLCFCQEERDIRLCLLFGKEQRCQLLRRAAFIPVHVRRVKGAAVIIHLLLLHQPVKHLVDIHFRDCLPAIPGV